MLAPITRVAVGRGNRFGSGRSPLAARAIAKSNASMANGSIIDDVGKGCAPDSQAQAVSDGDVRPATLGNVLYARRSQALTSEREWVDLVRAIAAGNQVALHRLYERTHRLVFTLAARLSGNRETAEELTLDVFLEVWRRADRYDPVNGTVLGWIMNLARSRAIDRLRFEQRKKRVPSDGEWAFEIASSDSQAIVEEKEQFQRLRAALFVLTPDERRVIEAAFFSELTHAEVAAKFNEPLGTVKTRIRSGLLKLRRKLAAEAKT